jgi:hypothetical protein
MRPCQTEENQWRVRNFLREVFLLNDRLDYWRWHFNATCQFTPPFEQVTVAWVKEFNLERENR